jgi:GR25 family glycosyltransferase involved in LPS biosynthesis
MDIGSNLPVIPVYVINLDSDIDRMTVLLNQTCDMPRLSIRRVQAFRGRDMPDLLCHILTRNIWSHENKGALGCFISHTVAWQEIANQSEPFGIVAEDDAFFENYEMLATLTLPRDADFVFCNQRTAYPEANADVALRPVEPVLAYVLEHNMSVGTDGYILTQQGAKKLLEFVQCDLLFSHIDLAYRPSINGVLS